MIIKSLKSNLKKMIYPIRISYYNWRNDTIIGSVKASLKAKYGFKVSIGENTVIADNVTIGDYSYVNSNSYIENCIIGKFCSISSGVYIAPAEHDYKLLTTSPISGFMKKPSKVIIGNDVLISLNAVILQGIKIGDGAVIAAGAIVTKDVEPYEIVGGNPAKHLKFRFDDSKISELLNMKWWDLDLNQVKKLIRETNYIEKEYRNDNKYYDK